MDLLTRVEELERMRENSLGFGGGPFSPGSPVGGFGGGLDLDSPPRASSPPLPFFTNNSDSGEPPSDSKSLLLAVRRLAAKLNELSPLSDPSLVLHAAAVSRALRLNTCAHRILAAARRFAAVAHCNAG